MILSTFVVLRHAGDVQGPPVYALVGDLFVSCCFCCCGCPGGGCCCIRTQRTRGPLKVENINR